MMNDSRPCVRPTESQGNHEFCFVNMPLLQRAGDDSARNQGGPADSLYTLWRFLCPATRTASVHRHAACVLADHLRTAAASADAAAQLAGGRNGPGRDGRDGDGELDLCP